MSELVSTDGTEQSESEKQDEGMDSAVMEDHSEETTQQKDGTDSAVMEDDSEEITKQKQSTDSAVIEDDSEVSTKQNESTKDSADKKSSDSESAKEVNGSTEGEKANELEQKIIDQVEYYFGDWNLPRDRFLKEQVKLDDGWIPMTLMLKFQRLAKLSTDKQAIVAALRKSQRKLIEISEDGTKIRRSPVMPLPEMTEEKRKQLQKSCVYCKGFPKEGITLDMLKEFFQPHGETVSIQMRYFIDKEDEKKQKQMKGSLFVAFKNLSDAQKFMEEEEVKYGETVLIRKWQADYFEEKRQEKTSKKQKGKEKTEEETKAEDDGSRDAEIESEEEINYPLGTVLHLTELAEDCNWGIIKDRMKKLKVNVLYVDYKEGQTEAWIRMEEENEAKKVFEKLTEEKPFKIKDKEVKFEVLEGEAETQYLKKVNQEKKKAQKRPKKYRGSHHGRKRRGGPLRGGPPRKR